MGEGEREIGTACLHTDGYNPVEERKRLYRREGDTQHPSEEDGCAQEQVHRCMWVVPRAIRRFFSECFYFLRVIGRKIAD